MRQYAIVAILLAVTPNAQAQGANAAAILKACATTPGAPTDLCKSYFNGVIAGVLVDQVARERGSPICLPAKVTTDQVIMAVSSFIAGHQNIWTLDGSSVVGVALQTIFPCD